MTPEQLRQAIVQRLHRDLVGPDAPDEIIADRPSDRYLTGILFPRQLRMGAEEDDELAGGEEEVGETSEEAAVPLANCIKPASMGLSFAVDTPEGSKPVLRIKIEAARYDLCWASVNEAAFTDVPPTDPIEARDKSRWRRIAPAPYSLDVTIDFSERTPEPLGKQGFPGLAVFFKSSPLISGRTVTAVVLNENAAKKERDESERCSWFQVKLSIEPIGSTRFKARENSAAARTKDDQTAALIYRNAKSYAVGHTASAIWTEADGMAMSLETEWLPSAVVPTVSAHGDAVFPAVLVGQSFQPFSARWLGNASDAELIGGLGLIPQAWESWRAQQHAAIAALPSHLRSYAADHEKLWASGIDRMQHGIALLNGNAAARDAFRAANRAMVLQRHWTRKESDLKWYPFQIAFQLLSLESLLSPGCADRTVADLLWFPTGGGKTEAYLGCIAILLFYRRLVSQSPRDGGGVNVIMRYTLRVLTTQQFERAAALIAAADLIRAADSRLTAQERFRLGLWIGGDGRPKRVDAAHAMKSAAMDLKRCPCCGRKLTVLQDTSRFALECTNTKKCDLAKHDPVMPVWTVDEDIYRDPPSLLLGTIDKFAQIARNKDTGRLFGIGAGMTHRPPELIIQDELHLISGPLGTVAGLYEVAIDEMCRNGEARPKVIGSTATIKMADDQMKSLFNRRLYQFPPPGLDSENSCFAVRDDSKPGRLYLGITTAGRSAKFTLQAVCASLLQAASVPGLAPELEDAYWTLVAYFNSLRELGGAHVLMLDDVPKSIENYSLRHAEPARKLREPEELTSRRAQADIPIILADLGQSRASGLSPDTLLATNMISVGVDIPRLALMVVNGQPKTVAEYIQATSRVGRDKTPGLVVAIFNAGKPRDRSYYESFTSWHATLYRSVEVTSVTPFAPRAIDRALKAVLAAMVRHLVGGMEINPRLSAAHRKQVENIRQRIVTRCDAVDKEEKLEVDSRLAAILDEWEARVTVNTYWEDFKPTSLLISAERSAQLAAAGKGVATPWPAPNSMRTVEPTTPFRLKI